MCVSLAGGFLPPGDGEFLFLHPVITLMEVLFVTATDSDSQKASGTCAFPVLHIRNKKPFQQKPDGADQPFYLLWWLRTEKDMKHVLFHGLTVFSFPVKCVLWFNFTLTDQLPWTYFTTWKMWGNWFLYRKNEFTPANTSNIGLDFWGEASLSAEGRGFSVQTFLTFQQNITCGMF